MTLRPEGTAPAARAYVEHGMHTWPQPVKLWYHWPMFRYESPQSGRYRQHYQLGIEAFGSESPLLDAEVIGVLAALYRDLGLAAVELRLNSHGLPRLPPRLRRGPACVPRRVRRRPLSRVPGAHPAQPAAHVRLQGRAVPPSAGAGPPAHRVPLPRRARPPRRRQRQLRVQGIDFYEDHRLVRGMDYYTRTTFEFQSAVLGAQSGVGGGGRYDDLVETIGGPPTPGVGFGTGVERILLALERSRHRSARGAGPAAYLVALGDAAREAVFALAHELRSRGIAAELDYPGAAPRVR